MSLKSILKVRAQEIFAAARGKATESPSTGNNKKRSDWATAKASWRRKKEAQGYRLKSDVFIPLEVGKGTLTDHPKTPKP